MACKDDSGYVAQLKQQKSKSLLSKINTTSELMLDNQTYSFP